jgi:hypothetical protein
MIRKIGMLAAVFFLFLYAVWNFYSQALVLDPLSEVAVERPRQESHEAGAGAAYRPEWSKGITEKNLFSPARSYREQKPVASAPPVPEKRPEFVLKGIVLDSYGDYVAYLEIDKSKPLAVRKGDKIEKTEIVGVSARQAVLKWNGEIIDLSLERIRTIDNSKVAK